MNTQYTRALVQIREMILRGSLGAGQRVSEAVLAEILDMTRTPIRQALPALAQEGLLSLHGKRGYVVRGFTEAEIGDAIDVRGVLEGVAARQLAQRGVSNALLRELRGCLEDGDRIFVKKRLLESDEALYSQMNSRFHALIVNGAGSKVVCEALDRNNLIPFAGPQALAFSHRDLQVTYDALLYAHKQHHAIVEALHDGDGARVEWQMREHATSVKASANIARQHPRKGDDGEDVENRRSSSPIKKNPKAIL